jgi:hypothetical protein
MTFALRQSKRNSGGLERDVAVSRRTPYAWKYGGMDVSELRRYAVQTSRLLKVRADLTSDKEALRSDRDKRVVVLIPLSSRSHVRENPHSPQIYLEKQVMELGS